MGGRDRCIWIPTTIKNVSINSWSDIVIEFTRPITACKLGFLMILIVNGVIGEEDLEIVLIPKDQPRLILNWTML